MECTNLELDQMVDDLLVLRSDKQALQEQASSIEVDIRLLQGKIIAFLKEKNFKSVKCEKATVGTRDQTSYKLPDNNEDMEKLRVHLEGIGQRSMLKPNSITFNAWAKEEFDNAKAKGDPFFEIPGVGQPVISTLLSVTKVHS